tara:strand:+ start:172 stop:1152 length:981 start_codon:yes stop_codon:yes gene_type:complete
MKNLGIVEGFYGESLDFVDRNSIIKLLSENNLNYYLYAPKEDPFLRNHLDLEPTPEWQNAFKDFVDLSNESNVTIGVGLAPINKKHTADLAKKIELFMNLGVSSFSLLFDDIEQEFSLSEQLELFEQTKTKFNGINLNFCPTVYCSELITKDQNHEDYFNEFCSIFPKDEKFFWTGKKVISRNINKDCEKVLESFDSSNICIWDNYFTNDSSPKTLNLTFCDHIDQELALNKKTYLVNLTGMRRTNLLIVDIFGAFLSNSETKFEDILKKHGVDDNLIKIIKIFDPNQKIRLSEEEKKKLHDITFSWFHPLKNEWYPYLNNLRKGE